MNAAAIFQLVAKGISTAQTVWENRDLAMSAIASIKNIIDAHKNGKVTQALLDKTDADLDSLLNEFNAPLPPD